jgi:hypothetical protein
MSETVDATELFHLWCCDKDEALCGLDISNLPETDGIVEPKCETCYRLDDEDADCRKCVNDSAVPVCPECRDGKHTNCTEWALDPITDDVVACLCDECHKIK